jgi:hypothetical protein
VEWFEVPDYRIVFNAQTSRYRVERRRLWDWAFVMDESGEDYATFATYGDARRFLCARRNAASTSKRRWQVVDSCRETQPPA